MDLNRELSGRIVNRTHYTLIPVNCVTDSGSRVMLGGTIEPLKEGIVFTISGIGPSGANKRGQCMFAIHDTFGADTLSRLIVEWDSVKNDEPVSLSAWIEGRESAAVVCSLETDAQGQGFLTCVVECRN